MTYFVEEEKAFHKHSIFDILNAIKNGMVTLDTKSAQPAREANDTGNPQYPANVTR